MPPRINLNTTTDPVIKMAATNRMIKRSLKSMVDCMVIDGDKVNEFTLHSYLCELMHRLDLQQADY